MIKYNFLSRAGSVIVSPIKKTNNNKKHLIISILMLSASLVMADSSHVSGTVSLKASSTQVAGAMVTVSDSRGVSITHYTDEQGRWSLDQDFLIPPLTLRARAGAAFSDHIINIPSGTLEPQPLQIKALTDPIAISERLTASAHASSVKWDDTGTKQDFISQCHFCHQIGNSTTRAPKTEEQWTAVIKRMQGYGAVITWDNEATFAKTLASNFNGEAVATVRTRSMHDQLPGTVWREWSFGGPVNYVHDVELGEDGLIYGVDMSADRIWILNRKTNEVDHIQWPANDLPLGGMFAGAVAPLGTFQAHHGPHSIIAGPNGKLYTTNSLAAEIGIINPKTRETEFVAIGKDAIYPHTLRFDDKGELWFTLALSNQIGRMNIATKEIILIDLPSNGLWRWVSDAFLPSILEVASWFGKKDLHVTLSHHQVTGEGRDVLNLPYGIDVSPLDGSIWYSKLYSGYIGKIDPATGEVTEFETPFPSPRRLRFAKDGTLWIPSFESGVLMKFDTRSETFVKDYKLPLLAKGEYETPYAVGIEPSTQHVWIAANMSDRILRFNPEQETFVAYPSPTRVTFLRDFIFTPKGEVCTSNANLPSSAIEGGRGKLICLTLAENLDKKQIETNKKKTL
jgi:virginiamycin B lyase